MWVGDGTVGGGAGVEETGFGSAPSNHEPVAGLYVGGFEGEPHRAIASDDGERVYVIAVGERAEQLDGFAGAPARHHDDGVAVLTQPIHRAFGDLGVRARPSSRVDECRDSHESSLIRNQRAGVEDAGGVEF